MRIAFSGVMVTLMFLAAAPCFAEDQSSTVGCGPCLSSYSSPQLIAASNDAAPIPDIVSAESLKEELLARAVKNGPIDWPKPMAHPVTAIPRGGKAVDRGLSTFSDEQLYQALICKQRGVYGIDDRHDIFRLSSVLKNSDTVLKNADATVALIEARKLKAQPDGSSNLVGTAFEAAYHLCPSERFTRQPVCAFCSGVLVAPDIVATAGHCVVDESISPENIRIVFDFRMKDIDNAMLSAPAENVYKVVEVLDSQLTPGPDRDWALVRLDRPVASRQPAKMRASGEIRKDETVYVIGHPCGLPQKYAGGSAILNNDSEHFFSANLDTYGGNSGSPVFNKQSHEVEGLLVRGASDFIPFDYNGRTCFRSEIFPTTGTRGEDVSRVSDFRPAFQTSVEKQKKANSASATPARVP